MIPKDEQPYKIPDNWRWTYIKSVAEVVTGSTPSKKCPQYYGGNFPFFKPPDLDVGRHVIKASEYLSDKGKSVSRIIPAHSTAVCCIGSIGKCGYLEVEGTTNQQINAAIPKINPLYFYYYCLTDNFINELLSKASATTISIVNKTKMENCLFPLPPLDEQQRIVDIIENLFIKLDKAKALAQNVIDNYELRRSAILHKAFTGELTDTNLNITDFSEVANIKCNLVTPKDYKNYPHIAPDNIEKKTGKLISYRTIAEDKVISNKHRFYPRQILYSKIRPYLSKVIIAEFDGLCSADMYPIESKENTKYLWYYMLSDEFLNQASNAGSRTLLPKINQKELLSIKVPTCSLENQKEIVRILDSLLAKEQQTKELTEQILKEIDLMKKSILARAFRGELNGSE